mgnify:CR=1 FL=1
MYRTSKHTLAALVATIALATPACDKGAAPRDHAAATAKKAPLNVVRSAAAEPLVVRGEVEGVLWKHVFDGNAITGLEACGDHVYANTAAGRVVRWNTKAMTVEEVVEAFGAVSAIDAAPDGLLAGSSLGRLSMATCGLKTVESGLDDLLPVQFTALDPRSKTRALTIFHELRKGEPSAVASLVDLRTGRGIHPPFATPQPQGATLSGFVDYKGELWMGLSTRTGGSKLWYLERFDVEQHGVQDLADDLELLGLQQIRRQVWAFGARDDRSSGFIARVDTGTAQLKWDGARAWFGSVPGGDVPTGRPITYILQDGEDLLVFVPDGIYRTDLELRRWKRLAGPDSRDASPFRRVGGHVNRGESILVGSAEGLIKIDDDRWELSRVPAITATPPNDAAPTAAWWGERRYEIVDGELRITKNREDAEVPSAIDRPAAVAVDSAGRLWIVGHERIAVLSDPNNTAARTLDTGAIGVDLTQIASVARSSEDAVGFWLRDGSAIHFRLPK